MHGANGHAGDGHAREDVAGDLEQAHGERALEHGPRGLLDPPPRRGPDAPAAPKARRWTGHAAEAFARGEDDDAVARDEGELDEGQGDWVPEPVR